MNRDKELEALDMIRCPYDSNHVVKKSKFEIHLSKCEKNMNVSDVNKWKTCFFNYRHRIRVELYIVHLINCKDNHIVRNSLQKSIDVKDDLKVLKVNGVKVEDVDESENKVDEWEKEMDTNRKSFSIINEKAVRAGDVFNGITFTDSPQLSQLSKSERKRLNQMKVDAIRVKTGQRQGLFNEFTIDARFLFQDKLKTENQFKLNNEFKLDLKSIREVEENSPNKTHVSKMSENNESVYYRSLRTVISDTDQTEIKQIFCKDMRRPKTNPFERQLRRPVFKVEVSE